MTRDRPKTKLESADDAAPHTGTSGPTGRPDDETGEGVAVTIDTLYNELDSIRRGSARQNGRLPSEQRSEVIFDRVLERLYDGAHISLEKSAVKMNLDEILLVLIAHRSCDTNGKSLKEDLAPIFDTRLSPGTVHPHLHELEEARARPRARPPEGISNRGRGEAPSTGPSSWIRDPSANAGPLIAIVRARLDLGFPHWKALGGMRSLRPVDSNQIG